MSVVSDPVARTIAHQPPAGLVSECVESDDGELISCLRDGEDGCYEILVRRFGPRVLSTAKRYLRSEAEAHDCFQDTFIAVFEGIDRFEQRSSLGTWIRRIAINQCLMRIRAQGRRREESIDHLLPVFDENGSRAHIFAPINSSATTDPIDRSRTKVIVREKINALPDTYRVMLLLRDIDGYSTKEAAAIEGISVTAAKTRLHRARSALKSLLEPVMEHLEYHADM
jgi:RNA polymerase sigma-70 factor (ECF subfamily)